MKQKRKSIKKVMFWQDWGTFYGTTLVVIGFTDYGDVKKFLKQKKCNNWLEAMEAKPDEFSTHHFSKWKHKDITYHLLFLKDWKRDDQHYRILAHELIHAIQFCMTDFLDPITEYEAAAYQHSYLMDSILKRIPEDVLTK